MDNLDKISVVVTGVGGGGIGESVMKALRLLREKYRVIGTDMNAMASGLHRADRGYLVPSARDERYIDILLKVCDKEGVKVIIPGSDQELEKLVERRKKFEGNNIVVLANPGDVVRTCRDKWTTYEFLRKNNVGCPKSALPGFEKDLIEEVGFPLVVKPRKGHGSSYSFLVQDEDELSFFTRYLEKNSMTPMFQEYIGSTEQEYTAGVLVSKEGRIIGSIALRREIRFGMSRRVLTRNIRDKSSFLGLSTGVSQGIIDDFKEIRENAEKIALRLGVRGPVNIQCRLTEEGPLTFEINPRFSGTTPIRAVAGLNEPDILIRNFLLGERIFKGLDYKRGLVAMRGIYETYIDVQNLDDLKKHGYVDAPGKLGDYL